MTVTSTTLRCSNCGALYYTAATGPDADEVAGKGCELCGGELVVVDGSREGRARDAIRHAQTGTGKP